MTDAPEEPPVYPTERRGTRRPRVGDSGSPVGSTLSIILAVIAVIAGFLILRAITDDDSAADGSGGLPVSDVTTGPTAPTGPITVEGATTVPGTTQPSAAPAGAVYSGATIVVANASGVGGSAGDMSEALTAQGYEGVGEPGNATGEALSASVVYYAAGDAAAQAVAQSVATDLGGVEVAELPAEVPAEGGAVADATVLVMLGTDAAGRTIEELTGGAATEGSAAATVVPPPAIVTTPSTTG